MKGTGNQQDYGFRIYDPRLGRFLSIDPLTKKFPWLSSYQFSENNPIRFIDLDGAEIFDPFTRWFATDAAITVSTQPTSAKAKVYGAFIGVGGSVQGALEGTVNLVRHPVQSAKGLWRMATNTPVENAVDYAMNMADKYGDLPEPVQNYAVYGHFAGDMFMAASAFKSVVKPKSLAATTLREASVGAEMVTARINLATSFYKYVGGNLKELSGINFERAVQTITLKKGAIIQQWVRDGGEVGCYFAYEGADAAKLGIKTEGRTLRTFKLTEDVKVLQSKTKDIAGHKGGETQLYNPELKGKIQEVKQ